MYLSSSWLLFPLSLLSSSLSPLSEIFVGHQPMGALNLTERLPDWKADQAGADYSKDESNLREKIPRAHSRFFFFAFFFVNRRANIEYPCPRCGYKFFPLSIKKIQTNPHACMQIVCFKVQYSIYFTVHIYGVQIMDILDNPRAPSGVYLFVIITHPIWRFLTKEKIRATFQEGRAGGIIGRFIVLLSSSCIIVLLSIIEHCWRNRCTSPQFVYFICLLYF